MGHKLQQFRARAALTQSALAKLVGVTRPTYQSWETGEAEIPEAKLVKLAKALKTDPKALLGRHEPIKVDFLDEGADTELHYYGEVAIHFVGGGKPILLSISPHALARIHQDIEGDATFIYVRSLTNETVVIRREAIADLIISSDDHDYYGHKGENYERYVRALIPDPRDWEIVDSMALESEDLEDFDPQHVDRVRGIINASDEDPEAYFSRGRIAYSSQEEAYAVAQARTKKIFALATDTVWQSSSGEIRKARFVEPEELYEAFSSLFEESESLDVKSFICLVVDEGHRTYYINLAATDFVCVPTHSYDEGQWRMIAEVTDVEDDLGDPEGPGRAKRDTAAGGADGRITAGRTPARRRGRTRR